MTDEEMKRLEELAKSGWMNGVTAQSVLALIERVRKAEAKVQAIEGSTLGQALRDAERKGAGEMRAKAANEIQASGDIADLAETHGYRELEALVRSIPLPGDAP